MRQCEALEDFVRRSLEDLRQRLLDKRNDFLAEYLEVGVDGLIYDFAESFVTSKQVVKVKLASLYVHFDVHLVHDEVLLSVDLFVDSLDANVPGATRKVSRELSVAFNREEKDSSVNHVPTDHIQVRQFYLKCVLGCIFNDAAKMHKIVIKNAKIATFSSSPYFKFLRT